MVTMYYLQRIGKQRAKTINATVNLKMLSQQKGLETVGYLPTRGSAEIESAAYLERVIELIKFVKSAKKKTPNHVVEWSGDRCP